MIPRPRVLAALLGAAFLAVAPATAGASSASRSADAYRAVSGTPAARHAGNPREVDPARFHAFTVDHGALRSVLADAPAPRPTARRGGDALTVTLPGPDGQEARFAVQESPVLDAELAAAHPEIKTYAGVGVDDPTATVRMDLTPLGLHAAVRGAEGLWYVDPYYRDDRSLYVSYRREDLGASVHGPLVEPEDAFEPEALEPFANGAPRAGGTVTQHTYRLALVTDPTYAAYFGAENVLAAKATLMARVNQIYNDDVGVHLQLSNATLPEGEAPGEDPSGDALNLDTPAEMYGPNGPCGTAPCYTVEDPEQVACDGDVLNSNVTAIPQLMRGEPFEIGHIALGAPGGGVAELSAVGLTYKAVGCTGIPTPVGDFFAVDYVAHEMGHQFGGNHTFAGTDRNCSTGNRNDGSGSEGPSARGTSVEPGSGSSVMAYAGICDADDLQPHSDPYFSQRSIAEIVNHTVREYTALQEYQTVSLRSFGAGDAFRLRNGAQVSSPVTFGTGYTAAAIQAALAEIAIPGTAVTPYGTAETLGPEGFGIAFGDDLDRPLIEVEPADATTDVTGFAGETVKGGTPTNKGTSVATGNRVPEVSAPATATVPLQTPFTLTGSGTDPDGDRLSYLWEQNDPNKAGGTSLVSNAKVTGPLFRIFGRRAVVSDADALKTPSPGGNVASADPSRTFPDMAQILAGNTNAASGTCPAAAATEADDPPVAPDTVECFAEFLPTSAYLGNTGVARLMHFRLTARDARIGGGGTGSADTAVRIDPTAGPFLVTSQATPSSAAAGGPLAVTWNRANTDNATTNVQNVRILLSTDGGTTFPTVLATSTPNDDAETVTLPAGTETSAARIKVEAVGGVFFDVTDAPLTITAPAAPGTEPPTPTTPTPATPTPDTPAPTAPTPTSPAPTTPTPVPAPPTPTPTTATLRPSLSGLASRVPLASTGRVPVRVRCVVVGSGAAPGRCTGSVRITTRIGRRTVTIGTASLRGAPAGSTVRVRLTVRGRRLAARRTGVTVRVRVSVRTGGTTRTATKAVRVIRAR